MLSRLEKGSRHVGLKLDRVGDATALTLPEKQLQRLGMEDGDHVLVEAAPLPPGYPHLRR